MERPILNKYISPKDFKEFYWLKQELTDFCRTLKIPTNGSKIDLTNKIESYLFTGEIKQNLKNSVKVKSNFDWNKEVLSTETAITDSYKNTTNVRTFFINQIGSTFSFNVKFMKWMTENNGKNLGNAIIYWKELAEIKKDKNYQNEIEPQFEYNRYMRAFLSDNPRLSIKDAIEFWNIKRMKRGTNEYERTDLNLK